jgi:hypothetical protein
MEKLSPEEITRVVAKIRRRYQDYIYKFFKPKTVLFAFEERYMEALQKKADISTFLLAEISAVEELNKREEAKIAAGPTSDAERESVGERVERILEEQRERVRKYPDVAIHATANEEIRRLVGAMSTLEAEQWPRLSGPLRDTTYSRSSLTMTNLESRLRYLASLGTDRVPGALSRYLYHLNRFPRDYPSIDREEKEYILECAFFLHDLNDILERVFQNYPRLDEGRKRQLQAVQQYVQGVILDFRVKELKRQR